MSCISNQNKNQNWCREKIYGDGNRMTCSCTCHTSGNNSVCCSCVCDFDNFPKKATTINLDFFMERKK